MSQALLGAAQGASFLVLTQVASRGSTFIVNQLLLRYLSPALLGASVQLELFSISVLYFARESLRVALQRDTGSLQAIVNIAHIPLILGVPITAVFWLLFTTSGLPDVPWVSQSLAVYAYATLLELLTEPYFAVVQQKFLYGIRAKAETAATIARCLTTFAVVVYAHRASITLGVLPFAIGQLAYAALLLAIYRLSADHLAAKEAFAFTPKPLPSTNPADAILSLFPRPLVSLASNLYLQSAVKYVLTQGDALIITTVASLADQGAYALASNYGGLLARMLFQPIEESSRNLFAKLCAPDPKTSLPAKQPAQKASTLLRDILHAYALLGIAASVLGPSLAPQLLNIVAGARWSAAGAGAVLASYCYYIPLLALNGVSEAFVAAVASPREVQAQSAVMGVYFVAFASAAFVGLRVLGLGAHGLVVANCVNMALRVVWNLWFVSGFFGKAGVHFRWQDSIPSAPSLALAAGALAISWTPQGAMLGSYLGAESALVELVKTGAVGGLFVVVLLVLEREFVLHLHGLLIGE